jgi:hypothetical protein
MAANLHSRIARALMRGHAIHMEEHLQRLYFEEEQRFPLWIKAIVLLPVVPLGFPATLMWFGGGANNLVLVRVLFTVLALLALAGAALTFLMKLVTKLDLSHLHLRIHPKKWSLLPRRMAHKDIALSDISRWEVRTYNSLLSSEYWGWHFWGLGVAKGGRYLYVMRPSSPIRGRGVQLQLASGERVLVGSERPEELENAITTAKSASP